MRVRWVFLLSVLVVVSLSTVPVSAAGTYASPAFAQQRSADEAETPNTWGPLATARDGQQEPYKEAAGSQRTVQYFDKGRMELGANNTVTNGLLASEIVKGQIQLGNGIFQQKAPPAIPVAGDASNAGPTYAQISANASTLMVDAAAAIGDPTTRTLNANGTLGTYTGAYLNDPYAAGSHLEPGTNHNVPKAFCDYRAFHVRDGKAVIGLAISEAFWTNVKVGGKSQDVLVQVFERRVLTYTPTNAEAYRVEMGNIGQHYYQWRYSTTDMTDTTTTLTTAVTSTVTAF